MVSDILCTFVPCVRTITGVTRTYLASDGLGSETVDLSYNGSVLATALYGPYGVGRYATGTMPTSRGYTGQRQDSGSGLDYYGARYYDGAVGQFTSADTLPDVNPIVFGGEPQVAAQLLKSAGAQAANRFAYVGDSPETASDPTGHRRILDDVNIPDGQDLGPQPWLMGHPDVMVWGTSNNNMVVFQYSGNDLKHLYDIANTYYQDQKDGVDAHINVITNVLRDVAIGGLFGGIGLVFKAGAGVALLLGLAGMGTGGIIGGFDSISHTDYMDSLKQYVSDLHDAVTNGGSIDFVMTSVNGKVTYSTMPNPFNDTIMLDWHGLRNVSAPGLPAGIQSAPLINPTPQQLNAMAHTVLQQQWGQCVSATVLTGGNPSSCG